MFGPVNNMLRLKRLSGTRQCRVTIGGWGRAIALVMWHNNAGNTGQGLHTCSIRILVTIPYHMLTCCQQPDQNSDPNISQISEAWMINVMPRPPTGTGSNLCDECDGVWSQDDNLEYPSSWMSYLRVFSVRNGIIEGWGWPPTSGEVSSPCHHLGPGARSWTDDWSVNDDDVIVMLSSPENSVTM